MRKIFEAGDTLDAEGFRVIRSRGESIRRTNGNMTTPLGYTFTEMA